MDEDVVRLHEFFLKQDKHEDFDEFIQECFQSAFQCVKSGNPNKFYRIWEHETDIPLGIRLAFKDSNIIEALRRNMDQYLRSAQQYTPDTDTEDLTEEESVAIEKRLKSFYAKPMKSFPNLFESCKFYIDALIPDQTRKELIQLIVMYAGSMESMHSSATHNIIGLTGTKIDKLLNLNPDWVFECHKQQKKVNEEGYLI
jgi:hypothetical protein